MRSISKAYSIFMAFTMILCTYNFSFFSKLSFAYIGLLIFVIVMFLKKSVLPSGDGLKLLVFLTFITIISISVQSANINTSRMIIYIGKYFIWGIVLSSLFINNSFDKVTFYRVVYYISIIATWYLIIQIIAFSFLNIRLPNTLAAGILRVSSDEGNIIRTYRPSSFFSEPAYYGTYSLCALALVLFDKVKGVSKAKSAILLTAGIFLSTSTAGMYMIVAIYLFFVWYYVSEKNGRISKNAILAAIIVIVAVLIIVPNYITILNHMGAVGHALIRSINKLQHAETSSRLGGSYDKLDDLNRIQKIIGCGIGNEYVFLNSEEVYMNAITRLIIQSGYIGLIAFIVYAFKLLINYKDKMSRFIIIMYIVKCITGGAMFAIPGAFMLTFVLTEKIESTQEDNSVNDSSIELHSNKYLERCE